MFAAYRLGPNLPTRLKNKKKKKLIKSKVKNTNPAGGLQDPAQLKKIKKKILVKYESQRWPPGSRAVN